MQAEAQGSAHKMAAKSYFFRKNIGNMTMKAITTTAFLMAVAVLAWTQQTLAQEDSGPAPVEAFFCNMQEGKTMDDLLKVAGKFSKWADKNDPDYSAWILTPRFGELAQLPHVVWLGSNPNGDSMGKALDKWVTTGNDLQEEFNNVMNCGGHGLASSVEINAPDGPPGDGVVMFVQCSFAEGSNWEKAIAAHTKYAKAMRSLGAKGSNWLFFPMIGGARPQERNFDYWGVSTFKSWADYFAGYQIYVTSGYKKQMEIMPGVANCEAGSPTVWDVKLVRSGAS